MQMTLDSTTFYGCTVVVVVSIVGFVMEKREGNGALIEDIISFDIFLRLIYTKLLSLTRLNNEQRAAISEYLHVHKVFLFSFFNSL